MEVWTQGKHYTVLISLDRIAQQPDIQLLPEEDETVKTGTFVKVHWPNLACSVDEKNDDSYDEDDDDDFCDDDDEEGDDEEDSLDAADSSGFIGQAQRLVEGYVAFNPHATFSLGCTLFEATDSTWEEMDSQRAHFGPLAHPGHASGSDRSLHIR